MSGWTFDAGALIALDKSDRFMVALAARAERQGTAMAIPAGALAQAWRGGPRQARLARLLDSDAVRVVALGKRAARLAGQLCGQMGTSDVVDASVVMCARQRGHVVLTSDVDDLRRLDPRIRLQAV